MVSPDNVSIGAGYRPTDRTYKPTGVFVNCVEMTRRAQLRQLVQTAMLHRSLRTIAAEVGVSHTTIDDFLSKPDKSSDRTIGLLEVWAAGGDTGDVSRRTSKKRRLSIEQKAAAFDAIAAIVRAISPDEEVDVDLEKLAGLERTFRELLKPEQGGATG